MTGVQTCALPICVVNVPATLLLALMGDAHFPLELVVQLTAAEPPLNVTPAGGAAKVTVSLPPVQALPWPSTM